MSIEMEDEVNRWTACRKPTLVREIIQVKTTVSEAARQFDRPPLGMEAWVDQGKAGMENALKARSEDTREQYEAQRKALQEAMLELYTRKMGGPDGEEGQELILRLQQGLKQDGATVSVSQLCRWFEVLWRTVYHRSIKLVPRVQESLVSPIKQMIEAEPSFGYRTVAHLPGPYKNTVQRIFQSRGWQVRKRSVGHRPRIEARALVIDCHTRELLGYQRSSKP